MGGSPWLRKRVSQLVPSIHRNAFVRVVPSWEALVRKKRARPSRRSTFFGTNRVRRRAASKGWTIWRFSCWRYPEVDLHVRKSKAQWEAGRSNGWNVWRFFSGDVTIILIWLQLLIWAGERTKAPRDESNDECKIGNHWKKGREMKGRP